MIKLLSVSVRGAQEPAHSWAAATASTNICHLSKVTVAVSIICRDITYFRMAQNTKIPKIPKSLAKIMCIPKHLIVDCWDNWYCQKSSCILKVLVLFLCNLNSCKLFLFQMWIQGRWRVGGAVIYWGNVKCSWSGRGGECLRSIQKILSPLWLFFCCQNWAKQASECIWVKMSNTRFIWEEEKLGKT